MVAPLTRAHCDGCDKVLTAEPFKSEPLHAKLPNGTDVFVEVVLYHPLTRRSFELCAECGRRIIDSAKTEAPAMRCVPA